ncbi:MAG: glycosyltransferase family 2 protein [Ilumatobacter sp.]|nr:glycosyltransferase family 2 protein [Ilumatobacter sp.]
MIPSYNYAQYLTEAVMSAADQPEADVVIVDNGSTDASPSIGEHLAGLEENVRFVRHETNDGIISSFNRCRAEIRGDYAMLLCADDLLTPGSLGRAVEVLDALPNVGLVYGTALDFSSADEVDLDSLPSATLDVRVHGGDEWVERLCRFGRNPIRTPEAVMRSSIAAAAGGYEPACPYTSDLNLWLRMAARADVAYLRGPVQALFRQHGVNAGAAYPHNSLAELEQRWTAFELFLESLGDDARVRRWEPLARRTIADDARYSASRMFVVGDAEADDVLAFADRLHPGGDGPVERASWSLRRRLGPARVRWMPGFQVRPVLHRAQTMIADRRRDRLGIG